MSGKISEQVKRVLEWDTLVRELVGRCASGPGKNYAGAIEPLSKEVLTRQLRMISELKEIMIQDRHPDFSGTTDIEPFLERVRREGFLNLPELFRVRSFILASKRIREYLSARREELPEFRHELDRLDSLESIGALLIHALTDNADLNVARYPELRQLTEGIYELKRTIEKSLHKLIQDPYVAKALQEEIVTTRNDRFVLLLKSSMKGGIKGTVHDISSSGATLYLEPESITGLNNKLITLEMERQREVDKIVRMLSAAVAEHADVLQNNLMEIAYLDFLHAAVLLSIALEGNEPEIIEDAILDLKTVRHPLLSLMIPGEVIPNDIKIGDEAACLIVTGANTGGKTVLLKTIGLCSLMILHGLHVPASADSRAGVFRSVFADIGDDQSIAQSLSTYSGQIVLMTEMLQLADERTLLLIDEIMVATNPRHGATLARAILEAFMNTGARTVVTTHYPDLKELAYGDRSFQNASVSFDLDTLKPTYRLQIGIPGVSYTLEIARMYGMPETVLERSRILLDERELSVEELVERMQKNEQETADERVRTGDIRKELDREKAEYERLSKRLKERIQAVERREGLSFLEELKSYREKMSGRVRSFQNADMKEAGALKKEIARLEQSVAQKLDRDEAELLSEQYRPFEPGIAASGDRVYLAALEQYGTIHSIDVDSNSAEILLGGSIKTRVSFEKLYCVSQSSTGRSVRKKKEPKKIKVTKKDEGVPGVIQTRYNTVDLRGKRVDEALLQLEQELDKMMRTGINPAIIIHGHGTGALKQAVRSQLPDLYSVVEFRPGEQGEGGDGVTVVLLQE